MKIARRRRKILVFPALLILLKHCFLKQTGVLKIRNSQNFLANFPPPWGGSFFNFPPMGRSNGGGNFPPGVAQMGGGSFPKNENFPPIMGGKLDPWTNVYNLKALALCLRVCPVIQFNVLPWRGSLQRISFFEL